MFEHGRLIDSRDCSAEMPEINTSFNMPEWLEAYNELVE